MSADWKMDFTALKTELPPIYYNAEMRSRNIRKNRHQTVRVVKRKVGLVSDSYSLL